MPTGHTVAMAAVVGALTVGALHSQHEERKRLRLEREAEQEREAQDQKEDDELRRQVRTLPWTPGSNSVD